MPRAFLVPLLFGVSHLVGQPFLSTGAMGEARMFHTATLLNSGLVLVTGGINSVSVSSTAELYDPATGTWRSTRQAPLGGGPLLMNSARQSHSATLLANGQVLIAGGADQTSATLRSAEIFDPITETFTIVGSMANPHSQHFATRLTDGSVLVLNGPSGSIPEVFNPVTGQWSQKAPVPAGFANLTTALLGDGTIWAGDHESDANTNTVYIFDAIANAWTGPKAPLGTNRIPGSAIRLASGTIWIIGGYIFFFPVTDEAVTGTELYDVAAPPNGQDVPGPMLLGVNGRNFPLSGPGGFFLTSTLLADGRVLLTGGGYSGGFDATPEAVAGALVYDPIANTVTGLPPMSVQRYGHTATLLTSGQVLISGGNTGTIFAGSPTSSVDLWGTVSTGTIDVSTNLAASTFNISEIGGVATYNGSGTSFIEANAQAGTYTISFGPVTGYAAPPSQTLMLSPGGTIAFSGNYQIIPSIFVTTNNPGSTFTISGPVTISGSGESFARVNVPLGTYTIKYGGVPGFLTPSGSTQALSAGTSIAFNAVYQSYGSISVTTNLSNASFTISGPATYTGMGEAFTEGTAVAGVYTISFVAPTGYAIPATQTATLTPGGNIHFAVSYVQLPTTGTIQINTNVAAVFTLAGPVTYNATGPSFSHTVPPGNYTVTYHDVSGYITPPNQTLTLAAGQNLVFTKGNYAPITITACPTAPPGCPSSLSLSWQQGAVGPPAPLQVALSGNVNALAFAASASTNPPGGNWLSVSPSSGTTPDTLNLFISPGTLTPGTYQGTVTITANATNSPQVVPVNVTITAAPCTVQSLNENTDVSNGVITASVAPGSMPCEYIIALGNPKTYWTNFTISAPSTVTIKPLGGLANIYDTLQVLPASFPLINPPGGTPASYDVSVARPGAEFTIFADPTTQTSTTAASMNLAQGLLDLIPSGSGGLTLTIDSVSRVAEAFGQMPHLSAARDALFGLHPNIITASDELVLFFSSDEVATFNDLLIQLGSQVVFNVITTGLDYAGQLIASIASTFGNIYTLAFGYPTGSLEFTAQ